MRPGGNQGLIIFNGNSGNEYIELYNPSCSPVNVSGFFIGCRQEFAGTTSGGAFRIPSVPAATIPPGGHLVLGTSTSSADPNSIDIKLPDYTSNYCLNNATYNFILANADGWVALYDAQGTPIDALYWSSAASNISQTADFGGVPCVPSGSPGGVVLESAQQINTGYPGVLTYGGVNPSAGLTFSRIPDGGSWQGGSSPTVNDLTVGNCNGGACVTIGTITFTATKTNPTCSNANGTININVTSTGTATYAWSANASTGNSSSATSLAAGTYSVTVTQNGCTKDTSITLAAVNTLSLTFTNATNPTCAGNDGYITANLSGGTAPYTVTIDTGGAPFTINVPIAISQNLTGLHAGTVTASVVDASGCQANASAVLTAATNCCPYIINATVTKPTCGNANGSIAITLTNGSGTYNYAWSANAATGNTATASNLAAGTYHVTVTQGTCTKDTTITINSISTLNLALSNPVNPTCAGHNGSITGALSGGSAPYTVTIDTGGTPFTINVPIAISQVIGNLPAGTVNVSVTDAGGCQASATATLTAPANCCTFQISAILSPSKCGNANGSIAVTSSNGSGNYSYTWSANAATGNSANAGNLAATTYLLTVTDNGFAGCFTDTSFTLTNIAGPTITSATKTNETCAGTADGSITINTSGGTSPLTYSWSANANTGNSATANGLAAGTYNFTVTDANNCQAISNAVLTAGVCCNLQTSASATTTKCGLANGSVTVNVLSGGQPNYQYAINGGAGQSSNQFTGLAGGNYTIITTDANSCTSSAIVTVPASTNSVAVNVVTTDITCNGLANGSAIANATGGNGTLSLLWSNNQTTPNIQSLTVGTYSITATDVDGCTASGSGVVNEPPVLTISLGNNVVVCSGQTGSLTAPAGYTNYAWSTGQSTASISQMPVGNYSVTVTNSNGCTAAASVSIDSSNTTLDLGPDQEVYQDESITLVPVVSGSNNGTYAWQPPATLNCASCANPVATPTDTTKYYLTYTDENGCTVSDSITLNLLPAGKVFFPSAFSPNGDGHNDIFKAIGTGVKDYRLQIFNRWGELVFETTHFSSGWNGTYKGDKAVPDVYVYAASVTFMSGDTKDYKGSLTIIR